VSSDRQSLSFGQVPSLYDSARPGYPAAAAEWALGTAVRPGRGTAIDVGAGTGLLTRVLVPLAAVVIAVEPDSAMRAQLHSSVPEITALAGSAESIPVAAASADSVVCGQAYHWFDRDRAHGEIGRVVRPGGTFAAIWNHRDGSVDWVAKVDAAAGPAVSGFVRDARHDLGLDFGPLFEPVERREFRHEILMNKERLHALVASRSSYIVAGAAERAEVDARLAEVTAELPDALAMPYITVVYRAIRR
jgi:SAM-dependent methyltransferase